MQREQIKDTQYWYEYKNLEEEYCVDYYIYASEDAEDYSAIVRAFTEYDRETNAEFFSDEYTIIESDEVLSDKDYIELVRSVI